MLDRFLRLGTVVDRTGLSRSTIYRKIGEGTFPPQRRLGANLVAWSEAELARWMEDPMSYRAASKETAS